MKNLTAKEINYLIDDYIETKTRLISLQIQIECKNLKSKKAAREVERLQEKSNELCKKLNSVKMEGIL